MSSVSQSLILDFFGCVPNYSYKKTGKLHPMKTVSKSPVLKVVKPAKGKPRLDKSRRRR